MEGPKNRVMIDGDDFLLPRNGFQTFATDVDVDLTWLDSLPTSLSGCPELATPTLHMVVLDRDLGSETGTHWQPELMGHDCCQNVPIVIHSGSEALGDRQLMLASGAADFIVNTAATGQMQQVVERMMTQVR